MFVIDLCESNCSYNLCLTLFFNLFEIQSMNLSALHLTVQQINLHVTMGPVFPKTGNAMENLTVWITQMSRNLQIVVSLIQIKFKSGQVTRFYDIQL